MEQSAALINERGGRATLMVSDIRDPEAVQTLVGAAMEADGHVDIFVNTEIVPGERLPDDVLEAAQVVLADIMITPDDVADAVMYAVRGQPTSTSRRSSSDRTRTSTCSRMRFEWLRSPINDNCRLRRL